MRELRERGRRTRRRLLDAGIEVFDERGYHAARVDDVVAAARTSHGTFYLYFSNKEALFLALTHEVADDLGELAGSLGPIDDVEVLRAWLARVGELFGRYGPVIRAWTEAEVATTPVGRLAADVLAGLASSLSERIRRTGTDLDPDIAGLALAAMVERFHYYAVSGQVDEDPARLLDTLAAVTHAALFGAERPSLMTTS